MVAPEIKKKLTKINFTDKNRSAKDIKYIVKHYVGATGSAKANADYFYDTYRGASAHYFVGHNGEIYQVVNDNDVAWHCGASSYKHTECRNSNSIGVELCCKKDKNGKWYYTEETQLAAIKLFAWLMDKYDIPLANVLRHYDVTGKACGEPDMRKGNKVWSSFKADLKNELALEKNDRTKSVTASSVDEYKVKTTCNVLNIRSGASMQHKVVGTISEKQGAKKTYTIAEEKDGWGKLKSGAGWINLKYTKKV